MVTARQIVKYFLPSHLDLLNATLLRWLAIYCPTAMSNICSALKLVEDILHSTAGKLSYQSGRPVHKHVHGIFCSMLSAKICLNTAALVLLRCSSEVLHQFVVHHRQTTLIAIVGIFQVFHFCSLYLMQRPPSFRCHLIQLVCRWSTTKHRLISGCFTHP